MRGIAAKAVATLLVVVGTVAGAALAAIRKLL